MFISFYLSFDSPLDDDIRAEFYQYRVTCLSGRGYAHGCEPLVGECVPVGVAADLVLGGAPCVEVAARRGPTQLRKEVAFSMTNHSQVRDPGW